MLVLETLVGDLRTRGGGLIEAGRGLVAKAWAKEMPPDRGVTRADAGVVSSALSSSLCSASFGRSKVTETGFASGLSRAKMVCSSSSTSFAVFSSTAVSKLSSAFFSTTSASTGLLSGDSAAMLLKSVATVEGVSNACSLAKVEGIEISNPVVDDWLV